MLPRSSTMFLAEIGTACAISAYSFRHITSAYSLNVSDPIKGQPVQLSDYLFVFVCGLVFWLLVMLQAKLHDSGDRQADIRKVAKLAKLIAPITILNLCGCLLAPFMKLPLLVRFLVLFQVSSNLALLLIWAFLSLKERMILLYAHTQQKQKPSPESQAVPKPLRESTLYLKRKSWRILQDDILLPSHYKAVEKESHYKAAEKKSSVPRYEALGQDDILLPNLSGPDEIRSRHKGQDDIRTTYSKLRGGDKIIRGDCDIEGKISFPRRYKPLAVPKIDGVGGNVDEAGGSGSGHGSGASGREENRGRYGGNDGGGGGGGGGDRGASGSGYGSGSSGSRPVPASVSALAPASTSTISTPASVSALAPASTSTISTAMPASTCPSVPTPVPAPASVSAAGGDKDKNGGRGDPESGGRETNTEQAFKSSKITEMSLMLTAQTTATLMGFHTTPTPSSSSKALLVVALMDQLVAYLCGLTSILLSSNKPGDSKAAKIFADIGFVCTALGFILMVAMFVPWYLVLIAVLLFGVIWLIFFRNGLKTRATEVWNYLKNSTQNL